MSIVVSQGADLPWTWISLPKSLDGEFGLDGYVHAIRGKLLLLDASQVQRVGTSGMLNWNRFLSQIQTLDTQPVLLGATSQVVAQLNLSQSFASKNAVFSVLAPYYCPACELEQRREILVCSSMTPPKSPDAPCISCAQPAHFDDVESVFFRFLPHIKAIDTATVAVTLKDLESQQDPNERVVANGTPSAAIRASATVQTEAEPPSHVVITKDSPTPHWADLVFYILVGVVLAGLALVAMNWGTS